MLFEEVAKYYEKLEGISSRLGMIDILTEMLKKAKKEEMKPLIYMTQGMLAPPFEGVEIGIAEKLAEESIAIASGYSKEEVEKSFKKTGDLGITAEQLMAQSKLKRMTKEKFEVREVFEKMRKIAQTSGEGSKEAKIKELAELLASSSPLEARYIVRFALGELRLGVGDATILEALSKVATGERDFKEKLENAYNICSDLGTIGEVLVEQGIKGIENFKVSLFKPIRPALAERLPTAEEILERMGGKCAVESKYDGLRAQVHVDKKSKRVEIFSRRLERLTDMFPEIVKAALEETKGNSIIFEGEAISYDEITGQFRPFQETIQRKRKHGVEEKSEELPLHLFAFDLLYYNGEDYLDKPYEERRKKLEEVIPGNGTIRLADRIIATTPQEIDRYFEDVVSNGLEGIVAKDLKARYIAGARKFSWIKMKRSYKGELTDTVDLVIVGYYTGKGSRAEFGFGGLLAAVYNDKKDMFETITKIGTGFTEQMMQDFKKMLEKIKVEKKPARVDALIEPDFWVVPKYVITVKADEITKSPMHTAGRHEESGVEVGYALRFPRIVGGGVREDKSPEEATTTKEIIEMFNQQRKTKLSDTAP
ncbi:MAG: ATP-dependent DNA ligase [Candidatus Micrarchaeia archaeon]|jgi:DNA ligase-1